MTIRQDPVIIDGAQGEGGGQVLRTSLAMALIHGRPLVVRSIRAKRKRGGLLRQHLTALRAATEIGLASVEGGHMRSTEIRFSPTTIRHGDYSFAVGTAGSTSLVLQTILWPLLSVPGSSRLRIEGGTHAAMAPPFDYIDRVLLPLLRRMGVVIQARLVRHGFFPAGGGIIEIELEGGHAWRPLVLKERGELRRRRATALISRLSPSIGSRQLKVVGKRLGWSREELVLEEVESPGPGTVLLLEMEFESLTEMHSAFGANGIRAEQVGRSATEETRAYLASGAPVGRHLADQLLIPMTLAGGSIIRTLRPTLHTQTNAEVIGAFTGEPPRITREDGPTALIEVPARP
jgi:RNA 3'-terminal phosphate cyclase (ATP)